MSDLISVIIPVYNVAAYIEKCIVSLLNQTYTNIQIILIDDGSTDDSGKICDLYCKIDARIEVYHISNQGVSNARNKGLDYSCGKYVCFLDSDDFLEAEAIEKIYINMTESQADLVECSYYSCSNDKKKVMRHLAAQISKEDAIKSLLAWDGYITSFCWDKMYLKEKIGNIRFKRDLKIGEDDLFVFEYLLQCKKVVVIDSPLYNYLIRDNSAIGNVYKSRKIDSVIASTVIMEFCNKYNILQESAKLHVGLTAFYTYANLLNTVSIVELGKYVKDRKFCIEKMKACSFRMILKEKKLKIAILYKIAQYFPRIYKITGIIRKKKDR